MTTQRTDILLPVGRLVAGSLTKPQEKDAEGRPLTIKTGPQTGEPRQDWFFGVAIPKGGVANWWDTPWGAQILAVGQAAFPNNYQSPKFAWKITDGDSTVPNTKGKKPCDREGYPGNFIVHLSSGFAPKTVNATGSASIDPELIKPGHYVEVLANVVGNGSTQQPGVFLNHALVAYAGYGPEINLGIDAASVGFGQHALPAGATAVPLSALPAPGAVAGAMMVAPAVTLVPTTPHTAILVPPAPGGPSMPPPPPAAHVMLPAAQGATYEAYVAAGWSDAQMIANGLLQA